MPHKHTCEYIVNVSHLRAGTKEKCAAVFGEKFRGLSRGLVPGRERKRKKENLNKTNRQEQKPSRNNAGRLIE